MRAAVRSRCTRIDCTSRLAIEELGQLADRRQVERIDLEGVAQRRERVARVLEALFVDLGHAVQVRHALVRIALEPARRIVACSAPFHSHSLTCRFDRCSSATMSSGVTCRTRVNEATARLGSGRCSE